MLKVIGALTAASEPCLELRELSRDHLSHIGSNTVAFVQGNVKASRKKVLPLVRRVITSSIPADEPTCGQAESAVGTTETGAASVTQLECESSASLGDEGEPEPSTLLPMATETGGGLGNVSADGSWDAVPNSNYNSGSHIVKVFGSDNANGKSLVVEERLSVGLNSQTLDTARVHTAGHCQVAPTFTVDPLGSVSSAGSNQAATGGDSESTQLQLDPFRGQIDVLLDGLSPAGGGTPDLQSDSSSATPDRDQSCPATPPNSYMDPSQIEQLHSGGDHDLPTFNSAEMVQKIRKKKASVGGEAAEGSSPQGEEDEELDKYPYTPANSLSDFSCMQHGYETKLQHLPSFHSADMLERVRKKRESLGENDDDTELTVGSETYPFTPQNSGSDTGALGAAADKAVSLPSFHTAGMVKKIESKRLEYGSETVDDFVAAKRLPSAPPNSFSNTACMSQGGNDRPVTEQSRVIEAASLMLQERVGGGDSGSGGGGRKNTPTAGTGNVVAFTTAQDMMDRGVCSSMVAAEADGTWCSGADDGASDARNTALVLVGASDFDVAQQFAQDVIQKALDTFDPFAVDAAAVRINSPDATTNTASDAATTAGNSTISSKTSAANRGSDHGDSQNTVPEASGDQHSRLDLISDEAGNEIILETDYLMDFDPLHGNMGLVPNFGHAPPTDSSKDAGASAGIKQLPRRADLSETESRVEVESPVAAVSLEASVHRGPAPKDTGTVTLKQADLCALTTANDEGNDILHDGAQAIAVCNTATSQGHALRGDCGTREGAEDSKDLHHTGRTNEACIASIGDNRAQLPGSVDNDKSDRPVAVAEAACLPTLPHPETRGVNGTSVGQGASGEDAHKVRERETCTVGEDCESTQVRLGPDPGETSSDTCVSVCEGSDFLDEQEINARCRLRQEEEVTHSGSAEKLVLGHEPGETCTDSGTKQVSQLEEERRAPKDRVAHQGSGLAGTSVKVLKDDRNNNVSGVVVSEENHSDCITHGLSHSQDAEQGKVAPQTNDDIIETQLIRRDPQATCSENTPRMNCGPEMKAFRKHLKRKDSAIFELANTECSDTVVDGTVPGQTANQPQLETPNGTGVQGHDEAGERQRLEVADGIVQQAMDEAMELCRQSPGGGTDHDQLIDEAVNMVKTPIPRQKRACVDPLEVLKRVNIDLSSDDEEEDGEELKNLKDQIPEELLMEDPASSTTRHGSQVSRPGRLEGGRKKKIIPNMDLLRDDDIDVSLSQSSSDEDIGLSIEDEKTPDDLNTPDALNNSVFEGELDWDSSATSPETPTSVEPIPEYTAREELEDERNWRKVQIGDKVYRIDMKVIEPYKKVLSHGGYYGDGFNAIVVFTACYLPDRRRRDYHYVMDNLFLYVISTLELLVVEDYMIVYFHGATPRHKMPSLRWLKRCYDMIDRRLRKNLKGVLVVHPTLWLKTLVFMTRPFVSSKFSSKLKYVKSLQVLTQLVPTEYIFIPDEVKLADRKSNPQSTIPVKKFINH